MAKTAVTIRDVARVAGVSKSAVSAALTGNGRLSDETKAVILQTASAMGFEPNHNARRLQNKGINHMVGLFTLDLDLSVGTRKIKIIRGLLTQQGYDVPIHSCSYHHEGNAQNTVREMRLLCQQRPRAIICNTTDLNPEVLTALENYQSDGGVIICYDRPVDISCDQVIFDREDNSYRATKHLLELGHRDIGFFEVSCTTPSPIRVRGFAKALGEFGLTPNEDWLFGVFREEDFEEDGARMAEYFLNMKKRPTAVCIVNDYAAIAFISELQRAGLNVPQDVSVVSHDNRPIARYCNVPLTSVSHPIEAIAHKVVDLLLERLNGDCESNYRTSIIQSELIVRESACPPLKD
jgi:DNA-binding LacI/PurR family transcriptional regulator